MQSTEEQGDQPYQSPPVEAEVSSAEGRETSAGMRFLLPVGRSGWAIVAGYLGLFSLLLVPAPFALLAGILGVRDIRRHPNKHGMMRAGFGIAMGILGSLFLLVVALG